MVPDRSAPTLLRAVGLLADGPVPWDRPVPPVGAGVFVVELATPRATAPVELTRVGKWLEHVPDLRLDGERPTSRALAARLAAFWLPSQPVIYVGSSTASVGRKVAAIRETVLGDRRPTSAGHWLATLTMPAGTRIWWAATSATEEYEDALLAAFAEGVPEDERGALPDPATVLPFAVLARPTGERKRTGLSRSLLPEPKEVPPPPTRVVQVPDGDAEGARGEPPEPKARRSTSSAKPAGARSGASRRRRARSRRATSGSTSTGPRPPAPHVDALTVEGAERLKAELDELVNVKRPEVIRRIATAREHGDLKENAEYHAAREEGGFLQGRIQALEARLRTARIVEAPAAGSRVGLGSTVTVEIDGEQTELTIVGSSDSAPGAGRISSASPVGRALLGHAAGEDVVVATPAGEHVYRVIAVR